MVGTNGPNKPNAKSGLISPNGSQSQLSLAIEIDWLVDSKEGRRFDSFARRKFPSSGLLKIIATTSRPSVLLSQFKISLVKYSGLIPTSTPSQSFKMTQKSKSPRQISNLPSKSASSKSKQQIQQIQQIENQITSSQNQNLNPIIDLLDLLQDSIHQISSSHSSDVLHTLIYTLHRLFSSLIRQGRLHGSPTDFKSQNSLKILKDWLKSHYDQFITLLLHLIILQNDKLNQIQLDCLTILMNLVRSENDIIQSLKNLNHPNQISSNHKIKFPYGGFQSSTFTKLVKKLLCPQDLSSNHLIQIPNHLRAEFILKYLSVFDDIRYHFLKDATFICQSYTSIPNSTQSNKSSLDLIKPQIPVNLIKNLLYYLEALTTMPTQSEDLNQFWTGKPTSPLSLKKPHSNKNPSKKVKIETHQSTGIFDDSSSESDHSTQQKEILKQNQTHPLLSLRDHRKAFSECWIVFLSLSLNQSEIKRVLKILHDQVIPHMIDPKILMDFLVDCIDHGGPIAILSLNALFTLIAKHNLDYPSFYTRLYAILDQTTLHARHRPRFFRMLQTFLSSTHLPVNIVASFIKKLARLSLFAPPGAIITIIPFCYNLIKQHPSCMTMLHRTDPLDKIHESEKDVDPYDFDEPDPLKSGAIYSSLWELAGLRSHYLSSISTLAKVFSEAFDKPKYDMEDFIDHTYQSLFETELSRQIRKPPALSVFASSYKPGPSISKALVPDDIVSQMWKI
ncbi:hypothetical protein O181_017140 [Austropuccinia psidii MF-1]|uniref:CCAAT-binding factor domain-containing protein n=1 Tax=Austropuccinia psidii MF-1 TaxID=1389203 RepID=A0A9Q3C685_9BASI|nr:hypothetical protein [Austropuccinia psidii MF-1]